MYKHFGKGNELPTDFVGGREWNVDLFPKFLMANGKYNFFSETDFVFLEIWFV